MIYDAEGVLEPLEGKTGRRCSMEGCGNYAAWKTPPRGSAEPVVMCARCVLYGGSEWGHENRKEIATVGKISRQHAMANRRKSTHVPQLDDRWRLDAADSEKFLLGVKYTTALIKRSPFGRMVKKRAVMEAEEEISDE